MEVIDCTLRDGGHLNKWHFSEEQALASYIAARDAGVDFFEMGYRNYEDPNEDHGIFATCADPFILKLLDKEYNESCKLLVMVDASKFKKANFAPICESPFWGVRVAAYPHELQKAFECADYLLELGYHVFLNPMVTVALTDEHFTMIQEWKNINRIEALYIADSFGSMSPWDVDILIKKYKKLFPDIAIGFHAHNNLHMAMVNTWKALECGAAYVDATIYGMGRGAGNTPIEILLGWTRKWGKDVYDYTQYLSVIEEFYRDNVTWGAFPEYVISAVYNVHPSYAEHFHNDALGGVAIDSILKNDTFPVHFDPKAVGIK